VLPGAVISSQRASGGGPGRTATSLIPPASPLDPGTRWYRAPRSSVTVNSPNGIRLISRKAGGRMFHTAKNRIPARVRANDMR